MRLNQRPRFDPRGEFVCVRPLKINGRVLAAGDPVDKADFTPRCLRQLYSADKEGRPEGSGHIAYAPGSGPGAPAKKPMAVGPTVLPGQEEAPRRRRVLRRRLNRAA